MAQFDIASVNANSPLIEKFKKEFERVVGQAIVAYEAQKMKRVAGEATKDLEFYLENGQMVTLVIRSNGDVVRVKLNKKDLPISADLWHFSADSFEAIQQPKTFVGYNPHHSHAHAFDKAIKEIASKVRENQDKFDKRISAEKIQVPTKKRATTSSSSKQQTQKLKEEVSTIEKRIAEKIVVRDELKEKVALREQQEKEILQGATP